MERNFKLKLDNMEIQYYNNITIWKEEGVLL